MLPLEISLDDFKQLTKDRYHLLDVRQPEEYQRHHLNATLIPLPELPARLAELQAYRDRTLIVYCQHGVRSMYATQILRASGFDQVYSLAGGIAAYLGID